MLERELQWAHLKIQCWKSGCVGSVSDFLGPRSETLSDLQLELLVEEEPGVTARKWKRKLAARADPRARTQAASGPSAVAGESAAGGTSDRVWREVLPGCGGETTVIGYDQSEQLDVEPARYFVQVTSGEAGMRKLRQPYGECGGVAGTHRGKRFGERPVVIQTVVGKYCDHLPLYRQAAMLEREAGVEIGRATLDGWVMRVGELLLASGGSDAAGFVGGVLFTGR